MSLSQRLDKRIAIYTVGEVQDDIGQPIPGPVKVCDAWAEVKDKAGDTVVESDKALRVTKTNITIRARELPDALTVRYAGYEYRVDGPPLGADNRTLLLACVKIGKVTP